MVRIGVDIDDVCWPLAEHWVKYYNRQFNDNVKPNDIISWDIDKYCTKCDKETLFYLLEHKGFWDNIELYDGVYETLKAINDSPNYELYIITNSHYKTIEAKFSRFLSLLPFINEDQIIVASDKSLIDVDWLIDDNPLNLAGFGNGMLIERPHNSTYEFINIYKLANKCAKDLNEAWDKIKKEED